ncbi:MAG: NAD-dependent epimerase/dehydratase family protein [Candidatus Chlorobium antarcticum]|jgi:dihydroflavonol-4-reductase|nr:NAD-dependent epimerase/dehydratase family protein [Candidatus Chlorobium antarcticum]
MPVSTVVITGATGYIGSQLLLSLLSGFPDEVRLRVVARESSECGFLDGLPVEVVRADIGDQLALNDAFSGADTVFHCAGLISYARHFRNVLYAINTAGSASVVNACLQSGVRRLAMTSSIAAAGVPEDGSMVTEASSFQDWQHRNGYAESKHLAELEGLRGVAEGLEVVTISPGVVIGRDPLNPASLSSSNDVLRMVHKGLVPVFPTGGTGFVDVRDVADALVAGWRKGRSGERYLVVGHNLLFSELFERIGDLHGSAGRKAFPLPRLAGLVAGAGGELYSLLFNRSSFISFESIGLASRPLSYSNSLSIEELQVNYRPLEESLVSAVT